MSFLHPTESRVSTRPFEPQAFGQSHLNGPHARWEQPRQWFVQDKFQYVANAGGNYPFKVTMVSATGTTGIVAVAKGWIVRSEWDGTGFAASKPMMFETFAGTTVAVSDGDTVAIASTYTSGGFNPTTSTLTEENASAVTVPVGGFLVQQYESSAASASSLAAGSLSSTPGTGYWPLAEIAISSGNMTITPIFTGGVIHIPTFISLDY